MLSKKKTCNVDDEFKEQVLQTMRGDEITATVSNDELILRYGRTLHRRLGRNRANDISQCMRQLARLTIRVNAITESSESQCNVSLSQCLSGAYFDTVVEATRSLCTPDGSAETRPIFNNPSIGLKLGHALAKCAELKKGNGIRNDDELDMKEADAFLALHKSEWTSSISATSLATFKLRKYNCPPELPTSSDLVKLKEYQEKQIQELSKTLAKKHSYPVWRELCEVVFSRLVIFNRRRSGETAKLLLQAYNSRPKWEAAAMDDIKESLTPLEQQLLKR